MIDPAAEKDHTLPGGLNVGHQADDIDLVLPPESIEDDYNDEHYQLCTNPYAPLSGYTCGPENECECWCHMNCLSVEEIDSA